MAHELKQELKAEALRLGFHDMRCTSAAEVGQDGVYLDEFLALGRHGDMTWMAAHADRRRSLKALWPDAKAALVFSLSYKPDSDPLLALENKTNATVSVYAQGKDYHDIVKPKLKQVARQLQSATGADVKVFVDTAPVMEKPVAERAGLGWQGKHTNLVSRQGGSWFFIGVILTTADLPPDQAETDHCGACTKCLDICPTDAFPKPYQLDARRCISYLTIEHKGHIAPEFRKAMGNRIYGCDDCLAVCPWNKFAVIANEQRLAGRDDTNNPPLSDLLTMDDTAFRTRFRGTPVKRTGRDRMMRNILIAAGNSGASALAPHIIPHLTDPSPLVRAMAVWALAELLPADDLTAHYTSMAGQEDDPDVCREWEHAFAGKDLAISGADPISPKRVARVIRTMHHLFIFGLGFTTRTLAQMLPRDSWKISATSRTADGLAAIHALGYQGYVLNTYTVAGADLKDALQSATHVVVSAPPGPDGDPVLNAVSETLLGTQPLRWIGYLSTIGVYGDRQGEWIDESAQTAPQSARSNRRLAAEHAWQDMAKKCDANQQIFRLAGIYGPGRSAIDRVRAGSARAIIKPGQVFNRIHVEDAAATVAAALIGKGTHTVYNLADDLPAPPEDVLDYAAELLGVAPPPRTKIHDAELSEMARSFYSENKRVRNQRIKDDLGVVLKYPTYRDGLKALIDTT